MDGDTLLSDDQTFPYSDKDVELVCGSLVTIRDGILQVIHLTVKEFIRSPHEKRGSTCSSLLVNPESGNLQLTLVCLQCISKWAEPLIDLESKAPRIDWALDLNVLERRRARAPLLEYASFSWLVHMIECKPDDLDKIVSTFQKTFGSSRNFSWIETCMALQPDSALRLLVGIDEVRDWLYDRHQGLQLQQEAGLQYVVSWCTATLCVFEEYGAVLARRPWQVYLIDLYDIFSVHPALQKLWQKYGETSLRENDLHLKGYETSRPQQEQSKPHLQLQKPLETGHSNSDSVFLVHNEAQNLYIWGEIEIKGNSHCIHIQHDKTGRRLPPSEDFSLGSDQSWRLVDHELSPNGEYLVLFYNSKSFLEGSNLTLAYRITNNVSFRRRMNCEPWARVILRHTSNLGRFNNYSKAIMFTNNYSCITPIGTLDLVTGSRRPLPDNITGWIGRVSSLFYSRSGQYLFVPRISELSNMVQARRVDFQEPSHTIDFYWEDKSRPLIDVSPSGRYLVLGRPHTFPTEKTEEEALYIYDTKFKETVKLSFPKPLDYFMGKFHFSRDETRLIAFLDVTKNLTILNWDIIRPTSRLTSHASLDLGQMTALHGIHVNKAATSAVVVTGSRMIQRIDLGDTIEFLDVGYTVDEYPHRLSKISRDGSQWALVSYGPKGGKVQLIDLRSSDCPARHFVLQWSQSDTRETLTQSDRVPVGISPDLRVLIINAEVFDLTTINTTTTNTISKGPSKRLIISSFTIEAAPALLRPHRNQFLYDVLECQISPCNSYVIYVSRGVQWGKDSLYSSAFLLYHIDVQKQTSARLRLMLPERMISSHATFHPSLPLMTLSYASPTATELEVIEQLLPELRPVIIDLNSLEMKILKVPEVRLAEGIKK